jgi:hypothetical protein
MKDHLKVSDEQISDFIELLQNASKSIPEDTKPAIKSSPQPSKIFYSGIVPSQIDRHSAYILPSVNDLDHKVIVNFEVLDSRRHQFGLFLPFDESTKTVFEQINQVTGLNFKFKAFFRASRVNSKGRINEYNITHGSVVYVMPTEKRTNDDDAYINTKKKVLENQRIYQRWVHQDYPGLFDKNGLCRREIENHNQ